MMERIMRVLFALLAAVFFVIPAQAGDDATKSKGGALVLDGVKGESQDIRHKDSFYIESAKSSGKPTINGASPANSTKLKK
jgi:hypothetical protein